MVILSLLLIQEVQLSVSGEGMYTLLLNRLEDEACPIKVWLGKLIKLDMTPIGWLGCKTWTQTNQKMRDRYPQKLKYSSPVSVPPSLNRKDTTTCMDIYFYRETN